MKYKNKTTGEVAELITEHSGFYNVSGEVIPKRFIENSCEWEKIIEKDYEILSLFSPTDKMVVSYVNGGGCYPTGIFIDIYKNESHWLDCFLVKNSSIWKIHSIKRLSDGEIFSVGDETDKGTICHIAYMEDPRGIRVNTNHWGFDLDSIKKVKKVLFTTEDDVAVFEGNEVHWIRTDGYMKYLYCWKLVPNHKDMLTEESVYKIFAKKENAEEYIKQNEKKYSLKDVEQLLSELTPLKSWYQDKFEKWINSKSIQ